MKITRKGFTPEKDAEDKERKARLRQLVEAAGGHRYYAKLIGVSTGTVASAMTNPGCRVSNRLLGIK